MTPLLAATTPVDDRSFLGSRFTDVAPDLSLVSSIPSSIPSGIEPTDAPATKPLDPFLAHLRAGDHAARERLVREHAPRMLAVARRLLRCEHDAADALQDAFLSAFHAAPSFTGHASLSTWLHRITVNACLMRLRARARHPAASLDQLLPAFDQARRLPRRPRDPGDADASRHAAAHETCVRVRACIDRLPPAYRAVLLLRDIEGLTTAETAARLHCTPANTKTRLHRARRALKTLLEQTQHSGAD